LVLKSSFIYLFGSYCFNFLYFSSNFIFIPFQFLDAIKERKSLKKNKKESVRSSHRKLILVTGVEIYCGDEAYGFVEATGPCWGRGSLKIPRF
jgi:hypothetical protein